MGFLLSGVNYERVSLRIINSNHVGSTSLRDCHSHGRGAVMGHPILLGTNLTDSEFKQLYDLANYPKYTIREKAYFWVLSDLSIGCSNAYNFVNTSNRQVETVDEFLSYIKEQKLLKVLE